MCCARCLQHRIGKLIDGSHHNRFFIRALSLTGARASVLRGGVDGVLAQTVVVVHVRLTVPETENRFLINRRWID